MGLEHLQIKYVSGSYDDKAGFVLLDEKITEHETRRGSHEGSSRRLFYLALPPSVYPPVCKMIRQFCMSKCEPLLAALIVYILFHWFLLRQKNSLLHNLLNFRYWFCYFFMPVDD